MCQKLTLKKDLKNAMAGLKIPLVNLGRQYTSLKREILDAQDQVFSSGLVLDGVYVKEFEQKIATYCKRKYAVAVNSCTQALTFANIISKSRRILMPAMSFRATLNSALMADQDVFFADVDDQGLIDTQTLLLPAAYDYIESLMFVDLYGNIPDQNNIDNFCNKFKNIKIIEDAAQSFGSFWDGNPAGSFGDISCLSFDPLKNLPNYGSGGMILTDNKDYYETAKNLRDNGKYNNLTAGTNSKLSEGDCAVLLIKMNHFNNWQTRRQEIASFYNKNLESFVYIPTISNKVTPSWSKYVIQTDHQQTLSNYLISNGIECRINYPTPLPFLYAGDKYENKEFAVAQKLSKRVLSLPIYPEMTDVEVEYIVNTIIKFF